MKLRPWIAGSLLALLAIQPAWSETQRPAQEAQNEAVTPQPLRRAVSEEALLRREAAPPVKGGQLSREERLKLRQDVNAAGRNIYGRPVPARF